VRSRRAGYAGAISRSAIGIDYEPRRPDFEEPVCGLLATFGDDLIVDLSAASSDAFGPVPFDCGLWLEKSGIFLLMG
jgi:hypothetical protein